MSHVTPYCETNARVSSADIMAARILRTLASVGLVGDVGDRIWQATPVTKAMAHEGVSAGYRMM